MKRGLLGVALLAASAAASAQIQSGTGIGSNSASGGTASANEPAPLPPVPSTGPNPESAVTQSSAPRLPDPARSTGRCDNPSEQERTQCLREQASTRAPAPGIDSGPASTGSTGPGSTGTGSAAVK